MLQRLHIMDLHTLILLGEAALGVGLAGGAAYGLRLWLKRTSPPPAETVSIAVDETIVSTGETKGKATGELVASAAEVLPAPSLNQTLRGTRDGFWGRIQKRLVGGGQIEGPQLEELEEILYTSDLGTTTVTRLLDSVESQLSRQDKKSLDVVKTSLKTEIESILAAVPRMGTSPLDDLRSHPKPQVWMIVGVNGAGKTTTIGKLAHLAAQQGAKVLVAAGDTFRAAAQSQLKVWTERAQVEVFAPENVTDPGAVAFDAVQMAKSRGYDLVLIDTAGRLHTQENLMEELKKVKRVIQKLNPEAPHETLIVLDANSGQNALVQAQKFHETLKLSGAVFSKMDGTAKGGVVLGLAAQLQIPTVFLGVGESMDALTGFNPMEFAEALFEVT